MGDDRGNIDGLDSDAHTPAEPSITMSEDGKGDVVEDSSSSSNNNNVENSFAEELAPSTSTSTSTASSTPPGTIAPSSSNAKDTNQADIDVLQAENALLRLALEEAQKKLRAATNLSGQSVRPVRSRSTSDAKSRSSTSSTSSKEPGNGGVAFAQMRRLLLKDDRFLREEFLPFLNMDDFGRCVESIGGAFGVDDTAASSS